MNSQVLHNLDLWGKVKFEVIIESSQIAVTSEVKLMFGLTLTLY